MKAMRKLHRGDSAVEAQYGRPIGILCRPAGPKLRVGTSRPTRDAEEGRDLHARRRQDAGRDETRVYLPHPEILAALEPGHTLLLDDGKVKLVAVETSSKRASPRRGRRQALGAQGRESARHDDRLIGADEKDRSDLEACLDTGVDWVALSLSSGPRTWRRPRRSRAAGPP